MLTKRIIPCLDVKDGRVVKGTKFVNLRDAGDPVEVAKEYERQKADELVFLDITASHERRPIILDVVRRTAETVFMPLTVGGGIRGINDVRMLLKAGADKCAINTAAVKNPEIVKEASKRFGSQCIVVAIDAKRTSRVTRRWSRVGDYGSKKQGARHETRDAGRLSWEVYIHGGRTPTGIDAVAWAKKMVRYGAGEILLTSMDRDGTKIGYDLKLTRTIADAVGIPVIASGGVGNQRHIYEGLSQGHADAALAASIFHFRELTVEQVKKYLKRHGIPVRL